MNSLTAALCHFLASTCEGKKCYRITLIPELCFALPEARSLGLIESPEGEDPKLDAYWVRLTAKGREAVSEGLCAMSEVA